MTSGLGEKLSRWVKLLLSYMLSVPHDEAFFFILLFSYFQRRVSDPRDGKSE